MRFVIIPLLVFNSPFTLADTQFTDHKCKNNAVAKLTSLQGKVIYDLDGNNQWQAAQLNDVLCEGSRVKVDTHSRATLTLANDINLRLDQSTVITLKGISPNKTTFLGLLKGFIHILSRTPQHLEISSPIANAGPEGTEFAMRVDDSSAAVWVYEGAVKFFNPQGSVHLKPGQEAQAQLGQAPRIQINIKPEDAVNWALYYPPIFPFPEATQSIDPPIRQAIMAYRIGHLDQALSKLDSNSAQQRNPYFYKVRAAMRLSVGQDALAMQDIQTLLASNPNDAEALALQAIRALSQNHKDQAYALATQAVQANPQSASAYSALSYVEQGQFQLNKALAAADKASQLAPQDAMVWARKAELELSQGLTVESQHDANKALTLDANLERSQTVMGFSDLTRTDINAARRRFERALQLDSSSPIPRLGLGLTKIRQGDLQAGRQDLEMAAVLDPNDAIIRSYLGKAYYEERRSAMADEQFTLAKARDPKDPTAYFYDAINKQTTNQPIAALQEMQKAINLNANRGVYRSKFLLDEDKAVRSANIGRIYKDLSLDDVARQQANHALDIDPSNYSAHRLLADSFLYRPRQEVARASEVLQAQLLQPLNYNPIQPQLAYSDLNIPKSAGFADTTFNEYSHLFEGNQHHLTATGLYGSNNTGADEAVLSGIHNQFAYSLGQMHYQTDGFRPNADLKHDLYNAFAQYELSSQLSVQAEYRHRVTEQGDIQMSGSATAFKPQLRRHLEQDTYRLGGKFSPSQQADWLFSFIYADRQEQITDKLIIPRPVSRIISLNSFDNKNGFQLESEYLYKGNNYTIALGGGTFRFDTNAMAQSSGPPVIDNYANNQSFGYTYLNVNVLKNVVATAGVTYDAYNDDRKGINLKISQFSPKLGLKWQVNEALALRMAGFQSVKAPIVVNQILQPVQIAGFTQNFDDPNGTRATQYGIGLDFKPTKNIYAGIEAFKRDLDTLVNNVVVRREEELYRSYFHWLLHSNWLVNSEFRFESFRGQRPDPYKKVETAYVPLNVRYFNDSGFFMDLGGQFVHQSVLASFANPESFDSNFFLLDAAVGYRFPKQYGMISLEAKNLLDKDFKYRDRSFQMNETRATDLIPERLLFVRVSFNI